MESIASGSGDTVKEIAQRALQANKEHQSALTTYAEQLQAQLDQLDKLLDVVESGDDDEDETPKIEVYIPGAKKATGLFPSSEFLNPESPFYEDASKRMRYVNSITVHPMKTKELEALADAVKGENMRLLAVQQQKRRRQEIGPEVPDIDLVNNTEDIDWRTVAEKVSLASDNKRTSDECRVKWLGDRHPRINHGEWGKEELEQLHELVDAQAESGKYNWVEIAATLGTNRTPIDCMRHGVPRKRHVWTPESDTKLSTAVEKFGINNWNLVARYVSEDATAAQCQGRYTRKLDPTIRRGAWSPSEDERLKLAVSAYGNSWMEVSSCVAGRTNDQCRERWNEQLNTDATRKTWNDEDDERLREAVGELGTQWKVVAERVGSGKTGQACRLRFDKLKKMEAAAKAEAAKQAKMDTAMQTAGPSTAPQPDSEDAGAESTATPTTADTTPKPRPRPRPRKAKGKGKEKEQIQDLEITPSHEESAPEIPASSPLSSLSPSPILSTPTIPLPPETTTKTKSKSTKRPATSSPIKSPGKQLTKKRRSSVRKHGQSQVEDAPSTGNGSGPSQDADEQEPGGGLVDDEQPCTPSVPKGKAKERPKPRPRGKRKVDEVSNTAADASTSGICKDVEPPAENEGRVDEPPAPQNTVPASVETPTSKKRGRTVKSPIAPMRHSARLAGKQGVGQEPEGEEINE